jgi:ketosteroid isomerase-like protein
MLLCEFFLKQKGTLMPTTPKEMVDRLIDAFAGRNGETLNALFAPDATWWVSGTLPFSGLHSGRDEILNEFLPPVLAYFKPGTPIVSLITNVVADDSQAAFELLATGDALNGNTYENHYVFFITVANGQITTLREYPDTLYVKDVLLPA